MQLGENDATDGPLPPAQAAPSASGPRLYALYLHEEGGSAPPPVPKTPKIGDFWGSMGDAIKCSFSYFLEENKSILSDMGKGKRE